MNAPYRSPQDPAPPRETWLSWLRRRAPLLLALLALAGAWWALRKRVDPRWQPLGVSGASVYSVASTPAGLLYVATSGSGGQGALVSRDRGRTFEPSGIPGDAVWEVTWLPRAQALCVGSRSGLFCDDHAGGAQGMLLGVDTYFAVETPGGVLAGGYPSVSLGNAGAREFHAVHRVNYAARCAAVAGDRVLLGGGELLASDDGGHTFEPVPEMRREVGALAAAGQRVYAAGGTLFSTLHRSDDGGRHWIELSCPSSQPERLALVPGYPDAVLLGTHGGLSAGDVFLSLDAGHTFRALGCPGSEVHGLLLDGDYLYCGATSLTGRSGLWRIPLREVLAR